MELFLCVSKLKTGLFYHWMLILEVEFSVSVYKIDSLVLLPQSSRLMDILSRWHYRINRFLWFKLWAFLKAHFYIDFTDFYSSHFGILLEVINFVLKWIKFLKKLKYYILLFIKN